MNISGPPAAVLFDLDGTFADTAPALAYALNQTLENWHQPTLPLAAIRPAVSQGGIALIKMGFDMAPEASGFEQRRQFLLDVYLQNIAHDTRLFPGIEQLLEHLEKLSIGWGIVTNKPAWLTDPLMQALGMAQRTDCIVSGDTCKQCKPHPQPLLYACQLLTVNPDDTIYIGDDQRDVIAGRAAGMKTIAATYGYIPTGDDPANWGADALIDTAEALPALLKLS